MRSQLGGEAVVDAAILTTSSGVCVPDVVWMLKEKWPTGLTSQGLIQAPGLVVKVLSPGKPQTEINHTIKAYLDSGIQEVIVVGRNRTINHYHPVGNKPTSTFGIILTLPKHFLLHNHHHFLLLSLFQLSSVCLG